MKDETTGLRAPPPLDQEAVEKLVERIARKHIRDKPRRDKLVLDFAIAVAQSREKRLTGVLVDAFFKLWARRST